MKFDAYMPVKVFSGKGCVKQNRSVFSSLGKKCLIVTGGSSAVMSGALSDCTAALEAENIEYTVYNKITANPLISSCYEAGEAARSFGACFIIGIGGGSPLDAAKAVAIYAENADMTQMGIYERAIPAKALPVVLIGTTAGTGSEVTGVSVLTCADTGRKKSISGADCYAKYSFCDYSYTLSVPPFATFSTAADAFAHAVESYLNSTANDLVYLYSAKAIDLLKDYITEKSIPDVLSEETREKLYTASIFAGLAINIAGCGFPHTVGYYLTENYKVPHGAACIAFMPLLLERAEKYCPEKLKAVETFVGMSRTELSERITAKLDFDFSIDEEEATAAAPRWKNGVKNFDRSPGGFTVEDAEKALASL